jgi:hypothetical protein
MNRYSGRGIVATFSLLFVGIANALFGGFGVAVTLPDPNDARQKDAVLAIQPVGCHGPGASVIARAEGIVNGVRQTVVLHPINLDTPLTPTNAGRTSVPVGGTPSPQIKQGDTFILKREWPAQGTWVLSITARKEYGGDGKHQVMDAHVVVPIDASGKILLVDRPEERNWNEAITLPDGKTKLLLYPFSGGSKVPATYIVSGDLKAAVAYKLHSTQ